MIQLPNVAALAEVLGAAEVATVTIMCAGCWSGDCGRCEAPCQCQHSAPRRLVTARPGQVR